jgi:hypothetical protein
MLKERALNLVTKAHGGLGVTPRPPIKACDHSGMRLTQDAL